MAIFASSVRQASLSTLRFSASKASGVRASVFVLVFFALLFGIAFGRDEAAVDEPREESEVGFITTEGVIGVIKGGCVGIGGGVAGMLIEAETVGVETVGAETVEAFCDPVDSDGVKVEDCVKIRGFEAVVEGTSEGAMLPDSGGGQDGGKNSFALKFRCIVGNVEEDDEIAETVFEEGSVRSGIDRATGDASDGREEIVEDVEAEVSTCRGVTEPIAGAFVGGQ